MARLAGGGHVAHALTGIGPFLLIASGWLSHLELGWAIPAERMFHESLSSGRTLVRYDRRGMVYSPAHGDTAFTMPMFDQFLLRQMPDWAPCWATLRNELINIPGRVTSSARRLTLHLPRDWHWAAAWQALFEVATAATGPPATAKS
jgi:hypothetical protein